MDVIDTGGALVGDHGEGLLASDPGAHGDPIGGGRRDSFRNEPIQDMHVREFRRALLKPKELTEGEPDRCVRKPFLRGKFALAKPSRSHIVSGGQAEGGGEESGAGR